MNPNDWKKRHAAVANALDNCGIGHDVGERFREGADLIGKTAGDFVSRAHGQLAYDLLTNVPCGTEIDDTPARHAVLSGLVSTISALIEWDIYAARRVAAALLEDVNDHAEAAVMYAKAAESVEG